MTTNSTTRRGFLGASALLVAGAILPPIAYAAPTIPVTVTVHVDDVNDDTGTIRVASCDVPMSSAPGLCEVQIADYDQRACPGAAWLNLWHHDTPGDQSLGMPVTRAELDALLASLTAVRDRAVAIGIL